MGSYSYSSFQVREAVHRERKCVLKFRTRIQILGTGAQHVCFQLTVAEIQDLKLQVRQRIGKAEGQRLEGQTSEQSYMIIPH